MVTNILKKTRTASILLMLFLCIMPAQAQIRGSLYDDISDNTQATAGETEEPADPQSIVIRIINVFLGLLGIIFLVLVVMSGYWFLTARGEEDMIKKGKDTLKRAIIGIIIVLLAYSIVNFVGEGLISVISN